MATLRSVASLFRHTPLHPQWLMREGAPWDRVTGCGGVVLDVGSASGWLAKRLDGGGTYVGLDYPTTAIPLYGTRPTVYGDVHRLPLANASVDAVACYEVLEHVVDPVQALAELSRVLVPGGVAECSMPFLYPVHDAPHDYQRWTRHAWMRHAEAAGFEVVAIEPLQQPFEVAGLMWAMAIAGPLERRRGLSAVLGVLVGLPLVLVANLAAVVAARVWPAWDAMCTGYRVRLVKAAS